MGNRANEGEGEERDELEAEGRLKTTSSMDREQGDLSIRSGHHRSHRWMGIGLERRASSMMDEGGGGKLKGRKGGRREERRRR